MNARADFIDALNASEYAFEEKDGEIVVTHQGSVYLYSMTTLPEGVNFNNKGYVYLPRLTTFTEGATFNNRGCVYLYGMTTLTADVTFNNQGSVDLRSMTTLTADVTFNNKGRVNLRRLTGPHHYAGDLREFRQIDGYTMILTSSRAQGGYTVHSARYFGGGAIEDLESCYIAEHDRTYAHGNSVKSAIADLQYKLADRADKAEIATEVTQTQKVTLPQFRAITGACREGIRQHLSGHGIVLDEIDEMPLTDALKAMDGTTYGDAFKAALVVKA